MSFESVRLEKCEPMHSGLAVGGTSTTGGSVRNVSSGSGPMGAPLVGAPAQMGWMSPEGTLKGSI